MPEIDKFSGSSSIEGVIKVKYDYEREKEKLGFEQNKGIKIKASEYEIIDTEKSSGIYSLDKEGIVDGNL